MKRMLLGGLASLLLSSSLYSEDVTLPQQWTQWVTEANTGEIYEPKETLAVNTVYGFRQIIPKSEAQGIQDLQGLVSSSETEELWAYLPEMQLWVEVGMNEKEETENTPSRVTPDAAYITRLAEQFGTLTTYHFHPDDDHGLGPNSGNLEKQFFYNALPSGNDIQSMVQLYQTIERTVPDATIDHAVVSQFGVSRYKPNRMSAEEALEGLLDDSGEIDFERISTSYLSRVGVWEQVAGIGLRGDPAIERIKSRTFRLLQPYKDAGEQATPDQIYDAIALSMGATLLEDFEPIKTPLYEVSFTLHDTYDIEE